MTPRFLQNTVCILGFLTLEAGLIGFDWRWGAVFGGLLMIAASLFGMLRKSKPQGKRSP